MSASNSILHVNQLDAWFGNFHALKNISVDVKDHDVMALIGPSGCGKSTFIRCLNRLHEEIEGAKVSGDVFLEGQNIYGPGKDPVVIRRRIGMVFQKPNPFPGLSIYDNVAIGLKLGGMRDRHQVEEHVHQALCGAALWDEVKDKLKRPGASLSGGQQQRLCIARALAVQPPVLLMDEPTSALDPISTGRIEELIQQLKATITVIIVTHNMQQAARIANRTAYFLLGEMVEVGQTQQIFEAPVDTRTRDYVTGQFG
ncbi:MAG: phosphate ABC transporter ATP-binding protein [Bdellovibrionaceae bacterium]|nr:phosphate ABC transporter ATP-binding protein [Pseudobdellovibrionaceae bacterium]